MKSTIATGLIFRKQPELDVVCHIEQIDRPVVGFAAELVQIGLDARIVELGRVLGPIVVLVGEFGRVLSDLFGNRREGSRLLLRVDHVPGRVELPLEEIEFFAALRGQVLHLDTDFFGQCV